MGGVKTMIFPKIIGSLLPQRHSFPLKCELGLVQYPNDPAVLLLDSALLGSDLAVLVLDPEKTC